MQEPLCLLSCCSPSGHAVCVSLFYNQAKENLSLWECWYGGAGLVLHHATENEVCECCF